MAGQPQRKPKEETRKDPLLEEEELESDEDEDMDEDDEDDDEE